MAARSRRPASRPTSSWSRVARGRRPATPSEPGRDPRAQSAAPPRATGNERTETRTTRPRAATTDAAPSRCRGADMAGPAARPRAGAAEELERLQDGRGAEPTVTSVAAPSRRRPARAPADDPWHDAASARRSASSWIVTWPLSAVFAAMVFLAAEEIASAGARSWRRRRAVGGPSWGTRASGAHRRGRRAPCTRAAAAAEHRSRRSAARARCAGRIGCYEIAAASAPINRSAEAAIEAVARRRSRAGVRPPRTTPTAPRCASASTGCWCRPCASCGARTPQARPRVARGRRPARRRPAPRASGASRSTRRSSLGVRPVPALLAPGGRAGPHVRARGGRAARRPEAAAADAHGE